MTVVSSDYPGSWLFVVLPVIL